MLDDMFNISQELWEMVKNFADESGLAVSDIINAAVNDYLLGHENTDYKIMLRAADTRIRQSSTLYSIVDMPSCTLIVKSPLQYMHRPAIKYNVEINSGDPDYLGWVNVVLRNRDIFLQQCFSSFISIWEELEQEYFFGRHRVKNSGYQTDINNFRRGFYRLRGEEQLNSQRAGLAIGEYISCFDTLLKLYLNTGCDGTIIEQEYLNYLHSGKLII
ncbi:MAG: hypothetical protein LBI03_00530 [Clostridiales bacterium]|jgi:hypothetical protein|nr:hypothetical protein [Clostridiales bacterium]